MNKEKIVPYIFLLVPLPITFFILIYPALVSFYISLTRYDGLHAARWTGLANYSRFFSDPQMSVDIVNTIIWVALGVILPFLVGMAIAVLADGKRFESLFKTIVFLPFGLSGVVVGIMWIFVYDLDNGIFNIILNSIGLGFLVRPWLGEPFINTFAMIGAYIWINSGFSLVITSAGLRSIPKDITDAAIVDGLSGWQRFRNVTFPLLTPFVAVTISMNILNALKVFDIIYVMTGGGPFRSSETLAVGVFFEAFSVRSFGYGSAISVILFAIVLVVSVLYIKYSYKRIVRY